jgi:hypothetical protein
MGVIPIEHVISILLEYLGEAYEGPSKGYTWFLDNQPDAGLFSSLAGLTADQASRPAVPGGTTIAAHVEHLRWSLATANDILRGGIFQPKWKESWTVQAVDPSAWEHLQADLRQEYNTLRAGIVAQAASFKPEWLIGTMAMAPHAAYHLGAMRQMIRMVLSGGSQSTL